LLVAKDSSSRNGDQFIWIEKGSASDSTYPAILGIIYCWRSSAHASGNASSGHMYSDLQLVGILWGIPERQQVNCFVIDHPV